MKCSKYVSVSLLCFLTICLDFAVSQAGCVWYDQCYFDEERNHFLNCNYTEAAKPTDTPEWTDEIKGLLAKRCPEIMPDVNTPIATCCSPSQVVALDENIKLAEGLIARCPTCLKNFISHICEFTCSPNQAAFATTEVQEMPDGQDYITVLNISVSYEYMEKTYNSCAGIVMPQSGNLAMDMLCDTYGAANCNPERFFAYMGDVEVNPFVPFQINFIIDESETALNPTIKLCNETYEGLFPCSCVDCQASCPYNSVPPLAFEGCTTLGVTCNSFIAAVTIFSVLTSAVIAFSIALFFLNRRRSLPITNENEANEVKNRCVYNGINIFLEKLFYAVGDACAAQPVLVLMLASWAIIGLCLGILSLKVTTDPVELWSSPDSEVRQQKDYFDSKFGPFYRTEQIFIQAKGLPKVVYVNNRNESITYGPAFNKTLMMDVINLQQEILKIGLVENAGLEKICFAPLRSPFTGENTISQCTVMSFFGYFGDSFEYFNESDYIKVIQDCFGNSYGLTCLSPWGGGVEQNLAFGGGPGPIRESDTIILTFLIQNHVDEESLQPALKWEEKFIKFMKNYDSSEKPSYMDISFSSERSIQDELVRVSQGEIGTAVISYVVMFIYIAISLGNIRSLKTILLDSKVSLGVVGILIVLSSVGCSLGFFGYIGVPTTLLIVEVLPFLVLAIGVDNIFILVSAYNDVCIGLQDGTIVFEDKDKAARKRFIFGKSLSKVGPSMLLTTASQCICFAIGSLSGMPAVNTFAVYAAVAIFVDFIFQITAFVAFLSLDSDRFQSGRLDLLCCVKQKQCTGTSTEQVYTKGLLYKLIKNYYAPALFHWAVKPVLAIAFIVWLCLSISVIPSIEIGLDQEIAMPYDSFVRKYLLSVGSLLQMGPPVYWVVTEGLNYSNPKHQDLLCGGVSCNNDSMLTLLYTASKYSDRTYLTRTANSWLDDFFDWSGSSSSCCQYFNSNDSFCPHEDTSGLCSTCTVNMSYFDIRPSEKDFTTFIPYFLQDNPDPKCAKGGHASYSPGLNYVMNDDGDAVVKESYFMGYHKTLRGSKEFYESYRYAKDFATRMTKTIQAETGNKDVTVFAYSIHYVFYEQYLTMWEDAVASLGYSLLVIFLVSFIFTGLDIFSATVILVSVTMILVDMMGLMYWWSINLNAVSLVNLVMCVGIAVEFCSHIVHSYAISTYTGEKRVFNALVEMGSNVLSGITLTKFAGIVVLAFSQSEIFLIFYFRMFLCIVLVGAAHGLIFLPILLHYLTQLSLAFKRK